MFNKKAQAAMEFLMTYGWAIMIVLIGIGALFFLGVFNPSTPSVCNVASPFICQDVRLTASPTVASEVTLVIAATGIDSATISNIKVNGGDCVITTPAGGNINSAKSAPVSVKCTPASLSEGTKVSGTFLITFTKQFGVSHKVEGSFSGVVEKS